MADMSSLDKDKKSEKVLSCQKTCDKIERNGQKKETKLCNFELTQEITELSTDLLTLSRVLGIFLDNAIEAASETEQKRFHIAIVCKVHSVIFHIENSTKPLLFPLEELFKPSISSKEAHSGLGLPTANMLIANAPELTSNTICENGLFKQILVVSNFKKNYHNIS